MREIKYINGRFERSLIYGFGVDDVVGTKEYVENGVRKTIKPFQDWKNMLKRCYCKTGEYLDNVRVCDEWREYSNFKKWFDENYLPNYDLDKDLSGGLLYSPDKCLYIPSEVNSFIISSNKKSGSYFDKSRGKFQSYSKSFLGKRVNVGRFDAEIEALVGAKTVKIIELNKLMDRYSNHPKLVMKLSELADGIYFNFILQHEGALDIVLSKPFFTNVNKDIIDNQQINGILKQ